MLTPFGIVLMKSSTILAVGTSMTCPTFIPAILIGAGLTSCRFGEFSFSVQVVLFFIIFDLCASSRLARFELNVGRLIEVVAGGKAARIAIVDRPHQVSQRLYQFVLA